VLKAPNAQNVMLDLSGVRYSMTSRWDGAWKYVALFDPSVRPTSAVAKETCGELLSWNMGWANREVPMTEPVTRRIAGVRGVIVFAVLPTMNHIALLPNVQALTRASPGDIIIEHVQGR